MGCKKSQLQSHWGIFFKACFELKKKIAYTLIALILTITGILWYKIIFTDLIFVYMAVLIAIMLIVLMITIIVSLLRPAPPENEEIWIKKSTNNG